MTPLPALLPDAHRLAPVSEAVSHAGTPPSPIVTGIPPNALSTMISNENKAVITAVQNAARHHSPPIDERHLSTMEQQALAQAHLARILLKHLPEACRTAIAQESERLFGSGAHDAALLPAELQNILPDINECCEELQTAFHKLFPGSHLRDSTATLEAVLSKHPTMMAELEAKADRMAFSEQESHASMAGFVRLCKKDIANVAVDVASALERRASKSKDGGTGGGDNSHLGDGNALSSWIFIPAYMAVYQAMRRKGISRKISNGVAGTVQAPVSILCTFAAFAVLVGVLAAVEEVRGISTRLNARHHIKRLYWVIPVVPLYTKILKPGFNTVVKPIFCLVRIVSPSPAYSAEDDVHLGNVPTRPASAPFGDPRHVLPQPAHLVGNAPNDESGDAQWRGVQRRWGMPEV